MGKPCYITIENLEGVSLLMTRSKTGSVYRYNFTGFEIRHDHLIDPMNTRYEQLKEFIMEELNYPDKIRVSYNNFLTGKLFDNVVGIINNGDSGVILPTESYIILLYDVIRECATELDKPTVRRVVWDSHFVPDKKVIG